MGDGYLKRQRGKHRGKHVVAVTEDDQQIRSPSLEKVSKSRYTFAHVLSDPERGIVTGERCHAYANLVPRRVDLLYRVAVLSGQVGTSDDEPARYLRLILYSIQQGAVVAKVSAG